MTGIDLAIEFRVKFNKLNTNKNKNLLPEEINLLLQDQLKKLVTIICSDRSNNRQEGYGDSRLRVDMLQDHIAEDSTNLSLQGTLTLASFSNGKYTVAPTNQFMIVGIEADSTSTCSVHSRKPCREFPTGIDLRQALNNTFYTTTCLSPIAEVRDNKIFIYENGFTVTNIYTSYCKTLPTIQYTTVELPFSDELWRLVVDSAVNKAVAINNGNPDRLKVETQINE